MYCYLQHRMPGNIVLFLSRKGYTVLIMKMTIFIVKLFRVADILVENPAHGSIHLIFQKHLVLGKNRIIGICNNIEGSPIIFGSFRPIGHNSIQLSILHGFLKAIIVIIGFKNWMNIILGGPIPDPIIHNG